MFEILKKKKKDKYETHYQVSLYAKVFKGLMINRLLLDSFAERLENVYVDILLRTHFNAIKKFKAISEQELSEKQEILLSLRKRKAFANFRTFVKEDLVRRADVAKAKEMLT